MNLQYTLYTLLLAMGTFLFAVDIQPSAQQIQEARMRGITIGIIGGLSTGFLDGYCVMKGKFPYAHRKSALLYATGPVFSWTLFPVFRTVYEEKTTHQALHHCDETIKKQLIDMQKNIRQHIEWSIYLIGLLVGMYVGNSK